MNDAAEELDDWEAEMANERLEEEVDAATEAVIGRLEEAEHAVRKQQEEWKSSARKLEAEVEGANRAKSEAERALAEERARAEQAEGRVEGLRKRIDRLNMALKDIHRTMADGDIFQLILKACMSVSGATRGLYLLSRDERHWVIRATSNIPLKEGSSATERIAALCDMAVAESDTVVCNEPSAFINLPPASEIDEFSNCAVIPVAMQGEFSGLALIADCETGDFEEDELEALLSIGDQAAIAIENLRLQKELRRSYLATISTLADAIEAKDGDTQDHCAHSAHLARLTSEQLGLSETATALTSYAALLHDVGKIGVSDGVLHKPGPLLPEERTLIQAHVRIGFDLIRNIPALEGVALAALHHHEWYDGSGYPDGLQGDQIPVASRVIAVVDAYGAMVSKRSYKPAYSREYAVEELRRMAGSQFDPDVVDSFLSVMDSGQADQVPDGPVNDDLDLLANFCSFGKAPNHKAQPV